MRLVCNRCNHRWTTRTEKHPSICPRCKSKKWDEPLCSSEISDLLNERCRAVVQRAGNVDYCTMNPQLLLTVMVAFAEAEKLSKENRTIDNAILAIDKLDIIKHLVIANVLPEELYMICWRLGESYLRDATLKTEGKKTSIAKTLSEQ